MARDHDVTTKWIRTLLLVLAWGAIYAFVSLFQNSHSPSGRRDAKSFRTEIRQKSTQKARQLAEAGMLGYLRHLYSWITRHKREVRSITLDEGFLEVSEMVSSGPKVFDEVFQSELACIGARREASPPLTPLRGISRSTGPLPSLGLTGMALSGGGVRSATFCFGVLQAFSEAGLYQLFDYCSTVSGGGYIASSLSSLLVGSTKREKPNIFQPIGERENPIQRHLRDYANYLSPKGRTNNLVFVSQIIFSFTAVRLISE
jgi:hypothetical protein